MTASAPAPFVPRRASDGGARIVPLADAIAALVADGDSVALEGFSHLVPFAAGHELIRQGRRDLTIIRMVPDIVTDQLVGTGAARRLVFAWAGNPGVGSLHRIREAIEKGWPNPIELDESTHAGMANRYAAGASGLPFALLRGYAGTGLETHAPSVRFVTCPFTGERLAAVAALNPDVAIIHAQRADRRGNVQLWGITGVQKEAVLASRRSLVTVEAIVDELEPVPGATILPSWCVSFVAEAPGGSWPSYTQGWSVRDDGFYVDWEPISRDRERFRAWIEAHVLGGGPRRDD